MIFKKLLNIITNNLNGIVFVLIFVGKVSPVHWQCSHENRPKNIQILIFINTRFGLIFYHFRLPVLDIVLIYSRKLDLLRITERTENSISFQLSGDYLQHSINSKEFNSTTQAVFPWKLLQSSSPIDRKNITSTTRGKIEPTQSPTGELTAKSMEVNRRRRNELRINSGRVKRDKKGRRYVRL